jgi:phosphatidate cytidylyltransferase
MFFIICLLSLLEFYKLVGLDGMIPLKSYGTFSGLFIFSSTFLIETGRVSSKYYFLILPVIFFVFFIKLYKKNEQKPFTNIAYTFLGILYVALPFSLLNFTIMVDGYYYPYIVLGLLILIWASDSGAYFFGVNFGRTKLFSRISPKKTWEGLAGGFISAILISLVIAHFTDVLTKFQWIGIALIIVVAGTFGDLVESLFKRSIAIKDSGTALPGHGGFLDRFDGLLLATPFIVAFLKIFT